MSLQHLRRYHSRYRLVTICAHGNFIVLTHREIRLLASWPDIPLSHVELTSPCPIILMLRSGLWSGKCKLYMSFKSIRGVWLDQQLNSLSPASEARTLRCTMLPLPSHSELQAMIKLLHKTVKCMLCERLLMWWHTKSRVMIIMVHEKKCWSCSVWTLFHNLTWSCHMNGCQEDSIRITN